MLQHTSYHRLVCYFSYETSMAEEQDSQSWKHSFFNDIGLSTSPRNCYFPWAPGHTDMNDPGNSTMTRRREHIHLDAPRDMYLRERGD